MNSSSILFGYGIYNSMYHVLYNNILIFVFISKQEEKRFSLTSMIISTTARKKRKIYVDLSRNNSLQNLKSI